MRRIAAHTWLLFLLPIVAIIALSGYVGKPVDLLSGTDVDYLDKDTVLVVRMKTEGQPRAKTVRYEAEAEDGSMILLYLQKDSLLMPVMGDMVMVETCVKRGGQLGDFDYGMYLRRQGIVGSAWAHRGRWQVIGKETDRTVGAVARRCQYWLHEQYSRMGIDGKELGIISALTLGYREDLDREVQRSFSASGAMHVLAVSGLHTGIVWGIVVWILTLGGWRKPLWEERWQRWVLNMSVIGLIWGYAFITGLSESVTRSALMLSFWALCSLLEKHTSRWNPLLAAAVVILLVDPLALWSVSFQLSFAAVAGIMWIGGKMQSAVNVRNRIVQYIVGLLLVSLAAQVGTMPLTLHYFGQTSNYFALTNLVVVPMAGVLLVLGFSTLAMSWCVVGEWLGWLTKWSTYAMREAVEWIEGLPFSTTQMSIEAGSVVALYAAIVCGVMMMHRGAADSGNDADKGKERRVNWWWLIGVVASLGAVVYIELIR